MTYRKSNPEHSSLLWILGLGAVGYFVYTKYQAATALPAVAVPSGTIIGTPATLPSATATATATAPTVGSVLTSLSAIAQAAQAKQPYIIPDPSAISQAPSGYTMVSCADKSACPAGSLYVRNDIASAILGVINASILASNAVPGAVQAPPATSATLYQFPIQGLDQLRSIMSAASLSGLAGYRPQPAMAYGVNGW